MSSNARFSLQEVHIPTDCLKALLSLFEASDRFLKNRAPISALRKARNQARQSLVLSGLLPERTGGRPHGQPGLPPEG